MEKFTDKMQISNDEQDLKIDRAVDDYKNRIEGLNQSLNDQIDALERNIVEIRA